MRILISGGSGFIGTHLIESLLSRSDEILNIDVAEPKIETHVRFWRKCSILDYSKLAKIVNAFSPTHVIHLAARTDCDSDNIADYKVNTEGTDNLLKCLKECASMERVVFVSSQFVHQNGSVPSDAEDFAPHTVYGESKVVGEKLVRNSNLGIDWVIARPTNIWGPYHPRYPYEFWRILKKNLYFHPGRKKVVRSYGFVGNVVYQLIRSLDLPSNEVAGNVFYVGDSPLDLYDWVNGFSLSIVKKPVRVVPRIFVALAAFTGEFIEAMGGKFPITLSRFHSMTHENWVDMELTHKVLGKGPYDLSQGIEISSRWFEDFVSSETISD